MWLPVTIPEVVLVKSMLALSPTSLCHTPVTLVVTLKKETPSTSTSQITEFANAPILVASMRLVASSLPVVADTLKGIDIRVTFEPSVGKFLVCKSA